MSNQILLSILIPSVPERFAFLEKITNDLKQQADKKEVEVLVFMDNRRRTIGAKRNDLIKLAQGKYTVFIDDDDEVSDDYVDQILNAIKNNDDPDCIVYDVWVSGYSETYPEMKDKICKYGIEYTYQNKEEAYYRPPNHLSVYRRQIALAHSFKDASYAEDDQWASVACKYIKKQVRINKILYFYNYVPKPMTWYWEKNNKNN